MTLKALIFARSHEAYVYFIREHHLKETECKFAYHGYDIQGYRKNTNPDLLLILLDGYWLTPAGDNDYLADLLMEFAGKVYIRGEVEAAARLIQLTYITRHEQLPEYLSHEHETVREAALKRQAELNGSESTNLCRQP